MRSSKPDRATRTSASEPVDVVVIGGGPAGAAAATRLARWGYDVRLLTKPARPGPTLAESLPPSIDKPLRALGLTQVVEDAGFYRTYGNTVWWADSETRAESFASDRHGYQVVRREFDDLLLRTAETAGAIVHRDATVRDIDLEVSPCRVSCTLADSTRTSLEARAVLDCSGRSGVVARRGHRVAHAGPSTLALVGVWHRVGGWGLADPTHTLVESYTDGWAWSVPVSETERYVTVMVDPRTTKLERAGIIGRTYRRELDKTRRMSAQLADATLRGVPWARDASLYSARRFGGPGFLLVGDAASFIDPLSSFGVKKALASAWLASVVTRTRLGRPELDPAAVELFESRETEMFEACRRRASTFFADVAQHRPHPFWLDRAEGDATQGQSADDVEVETLRRDPVVLAALESLRQAPAIALRMTPSSVMTRRPTVTDDAVSLEPCLRVAGWPPAERGIRFLRGVDLTYIVEIADAHEQVPDLYDAYQRDRTPVALPDFLGALSVLLAKGALRNVTR